MWVEQWWHAYIVPMACHMHAEACLWRASDLSAHRAHFCNKFCVQRYSLINFSFISGVNGAGKTTTFRMLTGDEWISAGDAYMEGYSIRSQLSSVQSEIGYCPQHDAHIHHMTGM